MSRCGNKPRRRPLESASLLIIPLLAVTISLLTPAVAAAETITMAYPSFTAANTTGMVFNHDAALATGDVIRLTPALSGQLGSTFSTQKISLDDDRSFSSHFSIRMHGSTSGSPADGMVFILQADTSTPPVVSGGGLGYTGIDDSLGIEFDTWLNGEYGDTSAGHVGVNTDGSLFSHTTAIPSPALYNNTWYVWIDYDGVADSLQIRMSTTQTRPAGALITHTIDLSSVIDADVFVGFSAATGGANENHDLRSLYFDNSYHADGITPATTSYSPGPATGSVVSNPTVEPAAWDVDLVAEFLDPFGDPVVGHSVTWSSASGTFSSDTVTTDASGHATTRYTPPATSGTHVITATASGGVSVQFPVTVDDYNVFVGQTDATGLPADTGIRFDTVTQTGFAGITQQALPQSLPAGYQLVDNGSYDVWTDAAYTGLVTITLPYPSDYPGDTSALRLLHYTGGVWTDVTSSVNVGAETVSGRVSSFSPFAVAGSSPVSASPASSWWSLALIGSLALALFCRRDTRRVL